MAELPVAIRLNPFKLQEYEGTAVPWNKWGRILGSRPAFTLDPLFHAGAYYVQDSSAMFVGHIFRKALELMPPGHLRVLDLCAAPGGKSTDLATSLRESRGDDFTLISNEVMKLRRAVLDDNISKWGDPRVTVCGADPSALAACPGAFDIILADVPCSGEGMFRKDEKARQQWSEQTVELCAARQKRILADAWPALREGGILIYSTCTYNRKENDDNLLWAAETLGGKILPPDAGFADYGVRTTETGNLLKAEESLGEGQWVGSLVKTVPSRSTRKFLAEALHPVRHDPKEELAGSALRIDFNPASQNTVDVNLQTALKYLHRDALVLPDAPLGKVVISYRGIPLGFVNNIGSRCNNLLPKSRRILMDINAKTETF